MFFLFKLTWEIQQTIDSGTLRLMTYNEKYHVERITKWFLYALFPLIVLCAVLAAVKAEMIFYIFFALFLIAMFAHIMSEFVFSLKTVLVSVRRFFTIGVLFNLFSSLIIGFIAINFRADQLINEGINSVLPQYFRGFFDGSAVIFFVVFGIIWNWFSVLANSKVASIANTIVAGALAIILVLASFVISMLPENITFGMPEDTIRILNGLGYSAVQFIQMLVNIATVPFLLINGMAVVLSQLKGYWVEKYNSGQEISWTNSSAMLHK